MSNNLHINISTNNCFIYSCAHALAYVKKVLGSSSDLGTWSVLRMNNTYGKGKTARKRRHLAKGNALIFSSTE